jgi:hypothetical protein
MNPTELLAQRHRDYAKAQDRHTRALGRRGAAEERVQALERELADAEDEDRRTLGDALVDETKPPARKTERARTALEKERPSRWRCSTRPSAPDGRSTSYPSNTSAIG